MQNLIDTETPNPSRFARTSDGKIDFDAYIGLDAIYHVDDLQFNMTVKSSRQRFGHLDLLVTPVEGAGERWVELKNLELPNDPAKSTIVAPVHTTEVVEEEVVEIAHVEPEPVVTTPVVATPAPTPVPSTSGGTHWTEVAPTPVAVATQEVVETTTTDMETQVENILNEDSPVIK